MKITLTSLGIKSLAIICTFFVVPLAVLSIIFFEENGWIYSILTIILSIFILLLAFFAFFNGVIIDIDKQILIIKKIPRNKIAFTDIKDIILNNENVINSYYYSIEIIMKNKKTIIIGQYNSLNKKKNLNNGIRIVNILRKAIL